MHMLHCLAFYAANYSFQITTEHIPSILNTAADALSRNNLSLFHSLVPQSQQVSLPQVILDLVINSRLDWGSQAWTYLFTHSDQGLSPATKAIYMSGWHQYERFCNQMNITPLPLTEHSQTVFATYLSQSFSTKTIRSYLCALSFYQI